MMLFFYSNECDNQRNIGAGQASYCNSVWHSGQYFPLYLVVTVRYEFKRTSGAIKVFVLSFAVAGVVRGEEPAVERASESSLCSKRAALQSQRRVRLRPATGVYSELGNRSHLTDSRRLEVGWSGELPPSSKNLRGYYIRLAVCSSVWGGPA